MNDASDPHTTWVRLRAERDLLRADVASTLAAMGARARDPFRLKELVRRHPLAVAGVAAGAGAILVNVLLPPDGPARDGDGRKGDDARGGIGGILDGLRDTALRIATPWIARFLAEHVERFVAGAAAPAPGADDAAHDGAAQDGASGASAD